MSILSDLIDYKASQSDSKSALVLGSTARAKRIAAFYRNDDNKKSLQLIMANGLLEFTEGEQFTPEEHAAFRKGLAVVLEFMIEAEKEFDAKDKQV